MTIHGSHDPALIVLSVLIAIAASFTALDLASRIQVSVGWPRYAWLATAALAMGGGIWAMHFVAMLAFSLPDTELGYDLGLTLLSLAVPIGATGLSFAVVSRRHPTPALVAASGLFMGLAVVAMHYLGMAAMKMPADLNYAWPWVGVSVLIAIGAATVALWLSLRTSRLSTKLGAAVVMGIAISGMHYASMQGAEFTAHSHASMGHGSTSLTQLTLALAVAASTFLILFLTLTAAMVDRRFAVLSQREALALRRSEERFRLLYQRTPLPLHSLDPEGRIEIVTDTWLELLGYERQEVIGRPLINFMAEASARQVLVSDWPQLLQDGEMRHVEYRMVTKGGEFLDVMASARVERAENGAPMRALGGLTDITERKRAEEALRQSQKIEAMGQLTGGVAHDFNNLLAVVMGNLELLRKRVTGDTKAAALIENALQGARRGAGLTQRLLAFARKQDLRPDAVDLPELVRGMAELLQRSIGPMIRVDTHFPLSLPPAHVDANQLELALLNLAVNARDAMPEGGTLTISALEEAVAIGSSDDLRPGKYVLLSVADTGMGMDAATVARATEPFFTTKGVGKGTGLGLSMAQGLAAQSGGRLAIQSESGRGTSVTLWLPAGERKADTARATAPIDPARAAEEVAPLTILAVDDDSLVLSNTAAMLEDMGHTVLQAASGHEALSIVRAGRRVDLVVTDQAMPGMTGTQLASTLRAEQPNLGILLVSGYADLPKGTSGSFPKLGKPFDQADLAQAIDTILRAGEGASVVPLRKLR